MKTPTGGAMETRLPVTVKIAVLGLLVQAGRLFLGQTLPALLAGDPGGLAAVPNIAMFLLLAWGVARLQSWAWWLAVIASTAGIIFPAYLFAYATESVLTELQVDRSDLLRHLLVTGGLSGATLIALLAPPTRRS